MEVINSTGLGTDRLNEYAAPYDTKDLRVYVRDIRKGARAQYSGVCYYKEHRIRVSVNSKNKYPVTLRTGSPFDRSSWRYYKMETPERLMEFVFLHELSHYLDYRNGIPVRCKQTKADSFALKKMGLLD